MEGRDDTEKSWLVRLPVGLYGQWQQLAKGRNTTAPKLLLLAMQTVLRGQGQVETADETDQAVGADKATRVRLPSGLWARWRRYAEARGSSGPRLLQRLMLTELDGGQAEVPLSDQAEKGESGKMTIKLTKAELPKVKEAARLEGHKIAPWIATLIRAKLAARPVFTATELERLSEATLQLAAVGRNLNSAVYRLHREGRWYENAVDLAALGAAVKEVSSAMNAVIDAASERGRF